MIYEHEDCGKYQDCPYRSDVGWCPIICLQYRHKDEVRVVRCKDCKWLQQDDVNRNFCGLGDFYCGEADYCSRGERRSDD